MVEPEDQKILDLLKIKADGLRAEMCVRKTASGCLELAKLQVKMFDVQQKRSRGDLLFNAAVTRRAKFLYKRYNFLTCKYI